MARANKYASINFNHVYDKNISKSTSSSNTNSNPSKHQSSASFYSTISSPNSPNNLYKNHLPSSSTRTHGRMLVLTRPTPKSISTIQTPPLTPSAKTPPLTPSLKTPPTHQAQVQIPVQTGAEPEPDRISLRPLGRTGAGSIGSSPVLGQEKQKEVGAILGSFKSDKFVPPHLRPGFVGREERPGPEVFRGKEVGQRQQQQQGFFGSSVRFGEDGRPKSGGYERMRRGDESNLGFVNRPTSSGSRPCSSG